MVVVRQSSVGMRCRQVHLPDICCKTLVRYFVSPGSVVTIMVRPYCFCC